MEHISAFGMALKRGVETLWCYAGQHLAAPEGVCGVVSGVLVVSVSRRSSLYFFGREHISAFGMTLNMGADTLWCYAGQHLAARVGFLLLASIRGVVAGSAQVRSTFRPS